MKIAGMDPKATRSRNSYDFFKHRWKVRSVRQTPNSILIGDGTSSRVLLAESAYVDVLHALEGIEPHLKKYEFGDATVLSARNNGILPIEAVIYYRGLCEVLDFHGLTDRDYVRAAHRDRLWTKAKVNPRLPTYVLAQYAREQDAEAAKAAAAADDS